MNNNSPKRHRDAGTGEFVSDEYASEHPDTTVSERPAAANEAEKFLKRVSKDGGVIVSSNDVTTDGITLARAEGRFFVDENNFGYVWIDFKRTWR